MDTVPDDSATAKDFASEAEDQRIAHAIEHLNTGSAGRRRRRTLLALADVDSGRLIDDEAMQAWADNLGTYRELPVPQPG